GRRARSTMLRSCVVVAKKRTRRVSPFERLERSIGRRLHREIGGLRKELRGEISGLGKELRKDFRGEIGGLGKELRKEFRGEIGGVRGEIRGLRDELRGEINGVRGEINGVRGE